MLPAVLFAVAELLPQSAAIRRNVVGSESTRCQGVKVRNFKRGSVLILALDSKCVLHNDYLGAPERHATKICQEIGVTLYFAATHFDER